MSSSRLAVVVLVVVAIAFVVITARGQGTGGGTPDWMRALSTALVTPAPVRLREIQSASGCFDAQSGFTVVPGRACDVAIAAADRAPVRTLTLTLAGGAKARVRVQPRESDAKAIELTVDAGKKPREIRIFEPGADLSLACEVPGPAMLCRLTLP